MKLTIENIIGYAAYGLKFATHSGKPVDVTFGFEGVILRKKSGGMLGDKLFSVSESTFLRNYKPILRPLSDLTDAEWASVFKAGLLMPVSTYKASVYSGKAWFRLLPSGQSLNYDFTDKQFSVGNYRFNQLLAFRKLYELHADLDGLIPQDLAIDINSLKK